MDTGAIVGGLIASRSEHKRGLETRWVRSVSRGMLTPGTRAEVDLSLCESPFGNGTSS